jgi:hypothetical protein
MVHAALLLLMLEAAKARPRFTISLKRSTQNLQLSTSSSADYPIYVLAFSLAAVVVAFLIVYLIYFGGH